MIIRAVLVTLIFGSYAAIASAQDPFKTAPDAYKLQFENEWVQVTRVHYGPHAKVPAHDHTRWPAAYVYLNDSGPIVFRHVGWKEPDLIRPPSKTGSFRLSPTTAIKETHSVENPTGIPSDFLRVEFKTRADDRGLLRGRFPRKDYSTSKNVSEVEFENGQVRVTRLICVSHQALDIVTSAGKPALLVVLTSSRLKSIGNVGPGEKSFKPGDTVWSFGKRRERLQNSNTKPIELLMFEFKTGPVASAG